MQRLLYCRCHGPAQRVVSEERAQRISRARTSRAEAYRLAQRASSAAAQAQRDAAVRVIYFSRDLEWHWRLSCGRVHLHQLRLQSGSTHLWGGFPVNGHLGPWLQ